jgi:hypothetical protein
MSLINKAFSKKLNKNLGKNALVQQIVNETMTTEEIELKKVQASNMHAYNQTLLLTNLEGAIKSANDLFSSASYSARAGIVHVKNTVTKLKNGLLKNIKGGTIEEYSDFLKSNIEYIEKLTRFGLGVVSTERTTFIVLVAKMASFINARVSNKFSQFLWVEFSLDENSLEYEIMGETISVQHKATPEFYARIILYKDDGIICWYDSENKCYILDNGDRIPAVEGDLYLDYTLLTSTLKNN